MRAYEGRRDSVQEAKDEYTPAAGRDEAAAANEERSFDGWTNLLGAMAISGMGGPPDDDGSVSAQALAKSIREAHSESFPGASRIPALLTRTRAWRAAGLTLVFRDEMGVEHRYEGSGRLKPVKIVRLGLDHYQVEAGGKPKEFGSKQGDGFYRALWQALLDPAFDDVSQVVYGGHEPGPWTEAAQYFRELIAQHVDTYGLGDADETTERGSAQQTGWEWEFWKGNAYPASGSDVPGSGDDDPGSEDEDVVGDDWMSSGADKRAAWDVYSQTRDAPPPQLWAHNWWETVTLLLYASETTGIRLQVPRDFGKRDPESRNKHPGLPALEARSVPAVQAEGSAPGAPDISAEPAATSAGQSAHEYIEMMPLGATAAAFTHLAADAGGWGLAQRLSQFAGVVAGQAGNLVGMVASAAMAAVQQARRVPPPAAAATALLGFLTYAWYPMFAGRGSKPGSSADDAEHRGLLTEEERAMLDSPEWQWVVEALKQDDIRREQTSPLDAQDWNEIARDVQELGAGLDANRQKQEKPSLTTSNKQHSRIKRQAATLAGPALRVPDAGSATTTAKPEERYEYWARLYAKTQAGSVEEAVLKRLAWYFPIGAELAAPRESFPLLDSWYTLMDMIDFGAFTPEFSRRLQDLSASTAQGGQVGLPDGTLAPEKWLHLGRYYDRWYTALVGQWGEAILHLNAQDAVQYQKAVAQVDAVIAKLERDWTAAAVHQELDMKPVRDKVPRFQEATHRLRKFDEYRKVNLSGDLKDEGWTFSRAIPTSEFLWERQSLSYLDKIDLSKFTASFIPELKGLIISLIDYGKKVGIHPAGAIDLVAFYTGLSLLSVMRLNLAMVADDPQRAYNYAVLDEAVIGIILENLPRLWARKDAKKFMNQYSGYKDDVQEEHRRMGLRLESREATDTGGTKSPPDVTSPIGETTTPASTATPDVSNATIPAIFSNVDWANVTALAINDDKKPLPWKRPAIDKLITQTLQNMVDQFFANMVDFSGADILNPDRYLDKWIEQALKEGGQEGKLTPDSMLTVTHDHSKDWRKEFTLRDIFRGKYRTDIAKVYKVHWPADVGGELRKKLELGDSINQDIQRDADRLFNDQERQGTLRKISTIMAKQAALNYIYQKSKVPGSGSGKFYQQEYVDAMKLFVKGELDPKLLKWHGEIVPGIIFISLEKVDSRRVWSHPQRMGVILSIWSGEYYEVPAPGLKFSYNEYNGKKKPAVKGEGWNIEERTEFRDFMIKHYSQRIRKAFENMHPRGELFGLNTEVIEINRMHNYEAYRKIASFDLSETGDYIGELAGIQKKDLIDFYDDLLYTQGEFSRDTLHQVFNIFAIAAGATLAGAGLLVGGPAWAYVLASMAATLLLEVVPSAILYSQADDSEEQQRYLYTMILAIALELGGSAVSELAAPVVKSAVYRLVRLAATATRDTLPSLFELAAQALHHAGVRWGVEPLRRVAGPTRFVGGYTREALGRLMESLDQARRSAGAVPAGQQEAQSRQQPARPDTRRKAGHADEEGAVVEEQPEQAAQEPGQVPGAEGGDPAVINPADEWGDLFAGEAYSPPFAPPPVSPVGDIPDLLPASHAAPGAVTRGVFVSDRSNLETIAREMREQEFQTRYRVVTYWPDPRDPDWIYNYYVAVGTRGDDTVVAHVSDSHFDRWHYYTYIFIEESEWVRTMRKLAEGRNYLVKYLDFHDFDVLEYRYRPLTTRQSTLPPDEYIEGAFTVFASPEYKAAFERRTGQNYDAVQEGLGKSQVEQSGEPPFKGLRHEQDPLEGTSTLLDQGAGPSVPWWARAVEQIELLPEQRAVTTRTDLEAGIIAAMSDLSATGPDIERFFPLSVSPYSRNLPAEELERRLSTVEDQLFSREKYNQLAENFNEFKAQKVGDVAWSARLGYIEGGFAWAYLTAKKFAILMRKAKDDDSLKYRIIASLVRLLNTKDLTIIEEAYLRLELVAERLYETARFHLVEMGLGRVLPLKLVDVPLDAPMNEVPLDETLAFVSPFDPLGRIMVVFPIVEYDDIVETLLHEMMHQSVMAEDFSYLKVLGERRIGLNTHHERFGKNFFPEIAMQFALGRLQHSPSYGMFHAIPELTLFEQILAQARLRFLPRLKANAKMHNPDSLVALFNAVLDDFKIQRKIPLLPGQEEEALLNPDDWIVTTAPEGGARVRRNASPHDELKELIRRKLAEDILASLFYQALTVPAEAILRDADLKAHASGDAAMSSTVDAEGN